MNDLRPLGLAPIEITHSQVLGVGTLAVALTFACGDWIAGAAVLVLWLGWTVLRPMAGTPALLLAFAFQWMQVTIGLFYYGLTGRTLEAIERSDYRTMVLIGLGCLVALACGIRVGYQLLWRKRQMREESPEFAVNLVPLATMYVVAFTTEGTIREFAWNNPSITQAVLALGTVRLGLLFLLFRRLSRPTLQWHLIGLVLGFEIVMGFIGYFAGFREPLILATMAIVEVFDRKRTEHRVALALIIPLMAVTGLLWLGVRVEYRRQFTELETFETTKSTRIDKMQALTTGWLKQDFDDFMSNTDFLVERLWVIYYPALTVARVPDVIPYTDGALMAATIQHLVSPRVFFPNKPELPSNSELVRTYAGVWVAGREQDTSIAFGYAAESYVDYGVPGMYVPMFVFGMFCGGAFAWLTMQIKHRDLSVALTTVLFWLALYLFERSWAKMVGDLLTMCVYLGATTVLLDRFLMVKKTKPSAAPVEAHA